MSLLNPFARARLAGLLAGFALSVVLPAAQAAAGQLQLVMFQRDGCSYCRRWDEEIAPAYPRTPQGQAAPLQRLDIKAPRPPGLTLTGREPAFTPTFVLTDDGAEVARIEGYAGDQFFWGLLDSMLAEAGWQAPASADPAPAKP